MTYIYIYGSLEIIPSKVRIIVMRMLHVALSTKLETTSIFGIKFIQLVRILVTFSHITLADNQRANVFIYGNYYK